MYLMINSHYNILYSFKLYFFFFLVASQLCKWCDCMLLLPRLINECACKFAKILLWSTRGLPWTVSSSVKISVFIIFIFISGTVFSACLEVGFRRFLFLSESNCQTQIVTQILYLHDWSTTLIRFSWLLRKAARVASFAVIVFEFFFNAVYAFLNILNEASLQWE